MGTYGLKKKKGHDVIKKLNKIYGTESKILKTKKTKKKIVTKVI